MCVRPFREKTAILGSTQSNLRGKKISQVFELNKAIKLFIRIFCCTVHYWYKELKRQELTWEHFLTKVTVIDDEEAWWDSSRRKDNSEEKNRPPQVIRGRKPERRKPKGLSERTEEFCSELDFQQRRIQKACWQNPLPRCD